ncbi:MULTISPECIES: MarR family winged helix-turn-helix transcriptional regulator [Paenibacillus]|uniref:DNA-binding MarR family transcriptional regulator n=1 Tax=Paenibacillus pabuli TaxID=1472 RepID=A0A855XTN3_9BACL|nr:MULTISPECIES: MarR family transcriptional regulator [Paenibacillus]PWW39687.1 DNA-binding MarR family transcriptional regulator [Paenibacillus pabuli]PXW06847.1 DNA-binding MarR family transcriptional regulator [Paenibacillus taichungensis]RAJ01162.1 DNA-binding MarR family transcriptional regulator [Paenibacillus pabuli]
MNTPDARSLVNRYLDASFLVTKRFDTQIRERLGQTITTDQFCALRLIEEKPLCTPSDLAELLCVGKSSITALVNKLVDRDLVHRAGDERDRRVVYLTLTDNGREVYRETEQEIQQILEPYLVHFKPEEVQNFIESFEKLAALLTHEGGQENE